MFKRLVIALTLAALLGAGAERAIAGGTGDAWTDDNGVGAGANSSDGNGSTSTPGHTGSGSGKPTCTYQKLSPDDAATADQLAEGGLGPPKGTGPGAWYRKECTDAAGNSTATIYWSAAPAPADPSAVAEGAIQHAPVSLPAIRMNPAADGEQLVNLQTWLWLDGGWSPVNATASAGAVTVTATATPERVVWDMGDGNRVTCEGPGTAYDPNRPSAEQEPSCSYTYRTSSARAYGDRYKVTATAYWHATWTATGVAAGEPAAGDLGTINRSSTVAIRVAEAEALNTSQ